MVKIVYAYDQVLLNLENRTIYNIQWQLKTHVEYVGAGLIHAEEKGAEEEPELESEPLTAQGSFDCHH